MEQNAPTVNYSPVIYLHNSGYKIAELLKKTKTLMESRGLDLHYTVARFTGICHEDLPGNLSLGCWNLPEGFRKWSNKQISNFSHGDAGVVIVDVGTWECKQYGAFENDPKLKEVKDY